jgi:CheY-specific phosphatase CheX
MAVKFFGQYLVEQGIVTGEALVGAINLQDKKNLKLGEIAVSMGYITPSDIVRAHNAQMSKDMKLGDLLVEMGLITINQLNDVIIRQNNTHLYIGEALVQVGALTTETLQQHLTAFKADQAHYISDSIDLPGTFVNEKIWEMTADLTYKMITRVLGLQFRPGKCFIATAIPPNFIRWPNWSRSSANSFTTSVSSPSLTLAAMDFSGDVEARYFISVSGALQKLIAKAILNEESVDNEPVEVLEDTVMEFINVVCGNVAAKASQMGVIMEINPPVTIAPPSGGLPVSDGCTALCFPIYIGSGDSMDLILQIKN